MHACSMCVYVHTRIHTCIHTCMHTYMNKYIHTSYMHAYILTYTHTCIRTHTYIRTYFDTRTHIRTGRGIAAQAEMPRDVFLGSIQDCCLMMGMYLCFMMQRNFRGLKKLSGSFFTRLRPITATASLLIRVWNGCERIYMYIYVYARARARTHTHTFFILCTTWLFQFWINVGNLSWPNVVRASGLPRGQHLA